MTYNVFSTVDMRSNSAPNLSEIEQSAVIRTSHNMVQSSNPPDKLILDFKCLTPFRNEVGSRSSVAECGQKNRGPISHFLTRCKIRRGRGENTEWEDRAYHTTV